MTLYKKHCRRILRNRPLRYQAFGETIMLRLLSLAALTLLVSACQTSRINQDFDASRDFAGYRSWSWKEPALQYRPDDPRTNSDLTEQRVRQAVAEQLDIRGLRPAMAGSPSDLKVQSYLIMETRRQLVATNYGGAYWGRPWGGYWGDPMYTEFRSYDYPIATVQIDLFDGRDGKLVWRGSAQQELTYGPVSPAQRSAAIREAVAKVLSNYPPH